MKALTVCQPWAWAIMHAGKRVENRTWRTNYRGPLLIHAGKSVVWDTSATDEWFRQLGILIPQHLHYGKLLGVVDVVDCLPSWDLPSSFLSDPFVFGPMCWVLANPRPLKTPIPLKGRQQLFTVPPALISQVRRDLGLLEAEPCR